MASNREQQRNLDPTQPPASDFHSSGPSYEKSLQGTVAPFVPYGAYFYLALGPITQKLLCERFCFHPQARKGRSSFGGMHISICDQEMKSAFVAFCKGVESGNAFFKHGLDPNRIEVTRPEMERLARDKVATTAASISGTEWKHYISDPRNVAFYDLQGRYICRADEAGVIVREISRGRVVRGIDFLESQSESKSDKNPLEPCCKPQKHFHATLYSTFLDQDGHSNGFPLATAIEIWNVIKEGDWHFVLSTDRDRMSYVGNPGQDYQFEQEWACKLAEPDFNRLKKADENM